MVLAGKTAVITGSSSGIGLGIAGCSAAVWGLDGLLNWRELWFALTAIGSVLLVPALAWLPAPDTSPSMFVATYRTTSSSDASPLAVRASYAT